MAKLLTVALAASLLLLCPLAHAKRRKRMSREELTQTVIQNTKPLTHPRGDRLPLFVWSAMGLGKMDDAEAEQAIRALNDRGIALLAIWDHRRRDETLAEGLRIAAIQKKLGLLVGVNANAPMHHFCNGEAETAHVDADGKPFFDTSFSERVKMGCPFALKHRHPVIREQLEGFAREYQQRGVAVDFVFADWEIDGALEWNDAWAASKRCVRCRERIKDIDDFSVFQKAIREIRSAMQREVYAEMMTSYFPNILVGNYAVYPHDGYRYWYDYFERFVEGAPHKIDGRAKHRRWHHEFPLTGFTFAMPVVYTWHQIFNWQDFENTDYRWFYNMLRVGSNAGEHTPAAIPIITFVHWQTVVTSKDGGEGLKQFSEEKYRELLWHLLLRGHDALFVWSPSAQTAQETRLAHEVYAASLEYREFLEKGRPVTFAVPCEPGPVVSALRLGGKLLVRRTDFDAGGEPVALAVGDKTVNVPRAAGRCQVIPLP